MTNEERTRFAGDEVFRACDWLSDAVSAERKGDTTKARALRIGAAGRLKEALRALERMEKL